MNKDKSEGQQLLDAGLHFSEIEGKRKIILMNALDVVTAFPKFDVNFSSGKGIIRITRVYYDGEQVDREIVYGLIAGYIYYDCDEQCWVGMADDAKKLLGIE